MAIRYPIPNTGTGLPHVLVTNDHRIYVDGHELRGVTSFDVSTRPGEPTQIQLVIHPASMLYGDPPSETVEDLHAQTVSGAGDTVDISKAIARAQERRQGR